MRISDMPEFKDKREVLSFDVSTNLKEAVDIMAKKNYGACLVTKDGELAGIFTERDLLRKVAAADVNMKKTKIGDVMTSNLKTATDDELVADCLRRMSQGRFRHLPVVDKNGKLRGMLSQGDFVAFTMSDVMARLKVATAAGIGDGSIKPITMLASIFVYTVGLIAAIAIASKFF